MKSALLLLGFICGGVLASAQTAGSAAAPSAQAAKPDAAAGAGGGSVGTAPGARMPGSATPATAAAASGPAPVENRELSSSAAALLNEGMPRYQPPPPPAPPKPAAEDDDAEDQPRNHIIRLPKYIVHEQSPPIFQEPQLYTKEGLARLALLRYQGLSSVPFAAMNANIATEMYREDQRLQNIAGFNDTADAMARGGDQAESQFIKSTTAETYQQSLDWGTGVPENPSIRDFPGSN